jgi:hypothetical protein
LALIASAACFNQCSVIQFTDYSFDLTNLKNFTITFDQTFVKITPCNLKACD